MSNILENNLVELFAFYMIKFVSVVFLKINKNNNFSNIISVRRFRRLLKTISHAEISFIINCWIINFEIERMGNKSYISLFNFKSNLSRMKKTTLSDGSELSMLLYLDDSGHRKLKEEEDLILTIRKSSCITNTDKQLRLQLLK